jgi:hypothetical protein
MPGKRVQFDDETWEAIEATIRQQFPGACRRGLR